MEWRHEGDRKQTMSVFVCERWVRGVDKCSQIAVGKVTERNKWTVRGDELSEG